MNSQAPAPMRDPSASFREPRTDAFHASRKEVVRRVTRGVLLAVAAAVLLTLSGAFGSQGAPFLQRLLYWCLLMVGGSLAGNGVSELFVARGWMDGPFWRVATMVTLAIAGPVLLIVWTLTSLFFMQGPPQLGALPSLVVPVLVISGAMTALNLALGRQPAVTHGPSSATMPDTAASAPEPPAAAAAPRFLDRLPQKLQGADLYAVAAEDHYLRLHTSRGSDLILFRLGDAIAELEGVEGSQTHRSWWVARDAVVEARRGDGRGVLVLKDGTEAPVSRTFVAALRHAGWF